MFKKTVRNLAGLFTISDEQAMWRVQMEGDHHAFGVLVDRWRDRIRALCFRITGDLHLAEDLAQEAFFRIYQKRSDYNPALRFSTWLWRIALNMCYDDLRRRKKLKETELEGESETNLHVVDPASPRLQAAQAEEAELVRKALLQLPEIYRTVLVLRHYEDLKLREIAEVLEVPEGTVNSRMAEALRHMTRLLEPEIKGEPSQTGKASPDSTRKEIIAL